MASFYTFFCHFTVFFILLRILFKRLVGFLLKSTQITSLFVVVYLKKNYSIQTKVLKKRTNNIFKILKKRTNNMSR